MSYDKLPMTYQHDDIIHNLTSPRIVVPELLRQIKVQSVLDVGCGTGTWLKVFSDEGISDYLGIDGDYVDQSLLQIPQSRFIAQNLLFPVPLDRKFDLIVCLEVAEHLPESAADRLVAFLTQHGDTIVFSAAIPGQEGQGHINEQWPSYWEKKFAQHGFYFHDTLRELLWNETQVQWWYSQNIFVINKEISRSKMRPIIHPSLFTSRNNAYSDLLIGNAGVQIAARLFWRALHVFIKKIFSKAR